MAAISITQMTCHACNQSTHVPNLEGSRSLGAHTLQSALPGPTSALPGPGRLVVPRHWPIREAPSLPSRESPRPRLPVWPLGQQSVIAYGWNLVVFPRDREAPLPCDPSSLLERGIRGARTLRQNGAVNPINITHVPQKSICPEAYECSVGTRGWTSGQAF